MKSTGEVMGVSRYFRLPTPRAKSPRDGFARSGRIFISVADRNKHQIVELARRLQNLGFELLATKEPPIVGTEPHHCDPSQENQRRPSQRPRLHPEWRYPVDYQHPQRQRGANRRRPYSGVSHCGRYSLYHDDFRSRGRRQGYGGNGPRPGLRR